MFLHDFLFFTVIFIPVYLKYQGFRLYDCFFSFLEIIAGQLEQFLSITSASKKWSKQSWRFSPERLRGMISGIFSMPNSSELQQFRHDNDVRHNTPNIFSLKLGNILESWRCVLKEKIKTLPHHAVDCLKSFVLIVQLQYTFFW